MEKAKWNNEKERERGGGGEEKKKNRSTPPKYNVTDTRGKKKRDKLEANRRSGRVRRPDESWPRWRDEDGAIRSKTVGVCPRMSNTAAAGAERRDDKRAKDRGRRGTNEWLQKEQV